MRNGIGTETWADGESPTLRISPALVALRARPRRVDTESSEFGRPEVPRRVARRCFRWHGDVYMDRRDDLQGHLQAVRASRGGNVPAER
jgi:hypothetical protein